MWVGKTNKPENKLLLFFLCRQILLTLLGLLSKHLAQKKEHPTDLCLGNFEVWFIQVPRTGIRRKESEVKRDICLRMPSKNCVLFIWFGNALSLCHRHRAFLDNKKWGTSLAKLNSAGKTAWAGECRLCLHLKHSIRYCSLMLSGFKSKEQAKQKCP